MVRWRNGSVMGIRAFLAMAILLNIPALAAEKVTVAQLESTVTLTLGKPDREAARKIDTLTLSERLSRERYKKLNAKLPGPRSRSALLVLPAEDVSAMAAPGIDEQRAIVLRAVQFAANIADKMPNFYATRDTTHYQSIELPEKI